MKLNQQPQSHKGASLTVTTAEALRRQIDEGKYRVGDKIPAEPKLTAEFGVSKTVVREAIASLRSDGLLESRQGSGVFVLSPAKESTRPFADVDLERVSSLIEMLELRTAIEGDAAALAAVRRSPSQEEEIIAAFMEFSSLARAREPTADSDFRFHIAVARASNNPRFAEFLTVLGPGLIPRRAIGLQSEQRLDDARAKLIIDEHEAIVAAIQDGDPDRARTEMRNHLKNSQARYRAMLRGAEAKSS